MLDRILRLLLGPRGREPLQLNPNGMVVVASSDGEPEALMLQELLRNGGVHAVVQARGWMTTAWGSGGSCNIVVLRKDLRRAEEILGRDPMPLTSE
jgi:hypothetical protein